MTQTQDITGCTFRFDRVAEADALLADICEHGSVALTTDRDRFIAAMYMTRLDIAPEYTARGATLVDRLRDLYDQVVAE